MCLRRTKAYILDGKKIIELPPREVKVYESDLNQEEREFYLTLFQRAQFQFNSYVKAGTVMKNYHAVLAWILRLRQACCHPSLMFAYVPQVAEICGGGGGGGGGGGFSAAAGPKNADGTNKTAIDRLLDSMSKETVTRLIENEIEKSDCSVCLDVYVRAENFLPTPTPTFLTLFFF